MVFVKELCDGDEIDKKRRKTRSSTSEAARADSPNDVSTAIVVTTCKKQQHEDVALGHISTTSNSPSMAVRQRAAANRRAKTNQAEPKKVAAQRKRRIARSTDPDVADESEDFSTECMKKYSLVLTKKNRDPLWKQGNGIGRVRAASLAALSTERCGKCDHCSRQPCGMCGLCQFQQATSTCVLKCCDTFSLHIKKEYRKEIGKMQKRKNRWLRKGTEVFCLWPPTNVSHGLVG